VLKLSQIVDEIIIFDLFGRIVTKQGFVEELSLDSLNDGVYIARIKVNNSTIIRRIIKE
jgi:bifunctional DNase/RNase